MSAKWRRCVPNIIFACFELNDVDAPILRALKTYALALSRRDADLMNRYIIGFTVDREPEIVPPRDLFEWAEQNKGEMTC